MKRNIENNLKQEALKAQKAVKKDAKKAAKAAGLNGVSRKELKQLAKESKAKIYNRAGAKVKALIVFANLAVGYGDKIIKEGAKEAAVELAKDKAVEFSQKQLINLLSKGIGILSKSGEIFIKKYGMKVFGAVGMFLDPQPLGYHDVIYDDEGVPLRANREPHKLRKQLDKVQHDIHKIKPY